MLAFILVFFVILGVLSDFAFSPVRGTQYYNKRRHATEFVNEPDNSLQVIGVGNSDLYSAFDPNYLWKEFGYTSNISAAPRQTPFDSYVTLKQMLNHQSPKVAVIEIDMIYTNDLDEKQKYDWREVMSDYCNTDLIDLIVKRSFPVFYYHDKWKHYDKLSPEKASTHGYVYIEKTVKVNPDDYMKPTADKEEISVINKDFTTRIVNLCRENNIYPVFVEVPSPASWNYERHNAVQEFADELGVDFIDFNLNTDETGFDYKNHFRDKGNHLNYKGSCIITKYLGNYIADKVSLDDRRDDPNYDYWNSNLHEFNKVRKEYLDKQKKAKEDKK